MRGMKRIFGITTLNATYLGYLKFIEREAEILKWFIDTIYIESFFDQTLLLQKFILKVHSTLRAVHRAVHAAHIRPV